ncbi:MAG: hypothetical protein ACRDE5_03900, partial [Ginsengibacter sp.]
LEFCTNVIKNFFASGSLLPKEFVCEKQLNAVKSKTRGSNFLIIVPKLKDFLKMANIHYRHCFADSGLSTDYSKLLILF